MAVEKRAAARKPSPLLIGLLLIPSFFLANWLYHAMRKPSEVPSLFEGYFFKDPPTTWRTFGTIFRQTSTEIVTPELLAALAQVESRGNSIATTYWTWKWSWNPFHLYAPASSSVGLFQITDGMFAEARHLCIHQHRVRREGPWYDWDSCWFTFLYNRLVPGHASEMTAAYLHTKVSSLVGRAASPELKHDLAATVHLCGAGVAEKYLRKRFRAKCGAHDLGDYLRRVRALEGTFARLSHFRR